MQVDVRFNAFETAKPLPRLAYALLRSPLLTLEEPEHPDLRAVANHLWASLPPDLLRCAIYPMLTSYSDPDTQVSLVELRLSAKSEGVSRDIET